VFAGAQTEVIACNDDTGQEPQLVTYGPHSRSVVPGYSDLGWHFRTLTSLDPVPIWNHGHLPPPIHIGAIMGAPAIATAPSDPTIVLIAALAVPSAKFPASNSIEGSLTGPCPPLGGACIARSTDSGATFKMIDCHVRDMTPGSCTGDYPSTQGHFYDAPSLTIAEGTSYAYAGFLDVDRGREAIWKAKDIVFPGDANEETLVDSGPFALETTLMGNLGPLDQSGNRVIVHIDSANRLWKMSEAGGVLKVNIHQRNGNAVAVADNLSTAKSFALTQDILLRAATVRLEPEFAFDVGKNEFGEDEMRFVYAAKFGEIYGIQGGYCTPDLECHTPSEWRVWGTKETTQFHPAIKYGYDATTGRHVWKVSYEGANSNRTQVAIFSGDLTAIAGANPYYMNFRTFQATAFQTPCPDFENGSDGYWGDHDDMGFNAASCLFTRTYADSSLGCDDRKDFDSHNVHVSAVQIPCSADAFTFGGAFQSEDPVCSGDSVNNAVTSDLSCPMGLQPALKTGRILTPENQCGANEFVCTSITYPDDEFPAVRFGGMFQVDDQVMEDCGSLGGCKFIAGDMVLNAVTGTYACPRGYAAVEMGRVLGPENGIGETQFVCEAPNAYEGSELRWRFGGSFQVDDCNEGSVPNPIVGGLYCPPGFKSVQYGRAQNPEGSHCGINQFACVFEQIPSQWPDYDFGGAFQMDDCNADTVPNSVTGGEGCLGAPWETAQYGRVLTPETKCGANQFVCTKTKANPPDPLAPKFGGMFQRVDPVADPITDKVPNPFTGDTTCPAPYHEVPIGRVLTPETEVGANQFVCEADAATVTPQTYHFGGTYQVDDCTALPGATRPNPLTGTLGCPAGYYGAPYGRVKNPEAPYCGINQFFCFRAD
jgi:hypothetical protein